MQEELKFTPPRKDRIVFSIFVILFSLIPIFFGLIEKEARFFLFIGIVIFLGAMYAALCISYMTFNFTSRTITRGQSCTFFKSKTTIPFTSIRQVGIQEAHYSSTVEGEGGIFYTVELRNPKNLPIRATKSQDLQTVLSVAQNLAVRMNVHFNPSPRRIFTGQWVLK